MTAIVAHTRTQGRTFIGTESTHFRAPQNNIQWKEMCMRVCARTRVRTVRPFRTPYNTWLDLRGIAEQHDVHVEPLSHPLADRIANVAQLSV